MSDDERAVARELLSGLVHDEPPVTTDTATLVRKGRRHTVIIRSAAIGSVTLGVVGAVFVATLAQPGPEVSTAIPVTSTSETTTLSTGNPVRLYTEDHRSRALTKALQDAKDRFIPAGLTAEPSPGGFWVNKDPALKVIKPNNTTLTRPQWPYVASADVGNDKEGYGSLSLHFNNTGTEGRCATPGVLPLTTVALVSCKDETLADGTLAAVSKYEGRNPAGFTGHESYRQTVVEAVRPDGTRIYVSTTNRSPDRYMASPDTAVLRAEPPLRTDDLLKIVQLPGLRY